MPRDPAQAVLWFRKAADQGMVEAQTDLGVAYAMGDGVEQDYAQAAGWFRKAADKGYGQAQNALGELYDQGKGVPQDYVLAHMWLNLAVAHASSVARRERVGAKMTAAQIDDAQKMARDWVEK